MAITKLSDSTVQRLKSTVLLLTPECAVKELVDNSLDAGATTIDVQISANTLDRIQVRDNGNGINSEDYGVLGRPAHTSKLRNFEELHYKAGKTLGFRGDALACVVDISHATITTRTAADAVAKSFTLDPKSAVALSPTPTSAPVGTTITLSSLYECMPVRKREYTKKAQQSMNRIRRQLQGFAMARPHIKITLKVLGKGTKLDWSYFPSRPPSVKDAVVQILGVGLASNCICKISSDASTPVEHRENGGGRSAAIIVKALLPKPGADRKAISGHGAFISIDCRPMTAARGTMKKLVTIFRHYLHVHLGGNTRVSEPFLQLEISTTPGSYDINVTSAKDEVLFAEEQKLLSLFESMCKDIYAAPMLVPTQVCHLPLATAIDARSASEATPHSPELGFVARQVQIQANKGTTSPPVRPRGAASHLSRVAEKSRLQAALDGTLPAVADAEFMSTAAPIEESQPLQQNQVDADGPVTAPIQAKLVGGKILLTRTRTTSTENDETQMLPVSSWEGDSAGRRKVHAHNSRPRQDNPWTIAGSVAPKTAARALSGPTASPPPTPGTFGTDGPVQTSATSQGATGDIHEQWEPVLQTPNYAGSLPVQHLHLTPNETPLKLVDDAWHGLSQPSLMRNHADIFHHDHGVSSPNGVEFLSSMDSMEAGFGAAPSSSDRHEPELRIRKALPSSLEPRNAWGILPVMVDEEGSLHKKHQPSYEYERLSKDTGRLEESDSWICYEPPIPDKAAVEKRALNRGDTLSLETHPPVSQLTLHHYLEGMDDTPDGFAGSKSSISSGAATTRIASGSCQRRPSTTTRLVPPSRGVLERHSIKNRIPCREIPSAREHDRAQYTEAVASTWKAAGTVMTGVTDPSNHLSNRRRSRSQSHPRMAKRRRSNRLPLEIMTQPTAGAQLVVSHMDCSALALDMDTVASYDAYILTGALSLAFPGERHFAKQLESRLRTITTSWAHKWMGEVCEVDLKLDLSGLLERSPRCDKR